MTCIFKNNQYDLLPHISPPWLLVGLCCLNLVFSVLFWMYYRRFSFFQWPTVVVFNWICYFFIAPWYLQSTFSLKRNCSKWYKTKWQIVYFREAFCVNRQTANTGVFVSALELWWCTLILVNKLRKKCVRLKQSDWKLNLNTTRFLLFINFPNCTRDQTNFKLF